MGASCAACRVVAGKGGADIPGKDGPHRAEKKPPDQRSADLSGFSSGLWGFIP